MKYGMVLGMIFLALLAFASVGYSAGSGSASTSTSTSALQVVTYSTIPATVYPGTTAQLQLTIENSGSGDADGVTANYQVPGQNGYSSIYVGNIGSGSTAIASVPFTVPQNATSGYFVININIAYTSASSTPGASAAENAPISIPVPIEQHDILSATTLSVTPQAFPPGGSTTAQLGIANTGGVMDNVVISMPNSSVFSIAGGSQISVGNVPSGASENVSLNLISSSSAPAGEYTIPVLVTYQDALQNTISQTISVGPVNMETASSQMRVFFVPITPTEVGSQAQFALTLENMGGSVSSAVVDLAAGLSQSSDFIPIGPSQVYFDNIAPGANQTQVVTLGVDETLVTGDYNFPVNITSNGNSFIENIGLLVNATPEFVVTTQTTPATVGSGSSGVAVSAQISNVGNGPVRSVYVMASPIKGLTLTGPTSQFIGTLNVDDYASLQLTVNVAPGLAPGAYEIPIAIQFKDSKNEQQTVTEYAEVDVSAYSGTSSGTTSGTSAYGSRRSSGLFGLGNIPLIVGALVVIVIAYFGYRRWKGGKAAPSSGKVAAR
jgi:hypothetical protein